MATWNDEESQVAVAGQEPASTPVTAPRSVAIGAPPTYVPPADMTDEQALIEEARRRQRRRHRWITGIVTVALVGVGLGLGLSFGTGVPGTTQLVTYQPWTAHNPSLRVSTTLDAHCLSGGVAGNSSYRCFTSKVIQNRNVFDPCFARPGESSGPVLCPTDPSSRYVVELKVSALGSPLSGAPSRRTWAFQLGDGQVCVLVNAAWGGLGPFSCSPLDPGQIPNCHVPKRTTPWWSAQCEENAAGPFSTHRVVKVWS